MSSEDRSDPAVFDVVLTADVLVIGGGPAGIWSALAAADEGASVVIAEKGYLGTSGPFGVGANTGIYYIMPGDQEQRDALVMARQPIAYGLSDPAWGYRTYDQSYANLDAMAKWGYEWPRTSDGRQHRGSLRGPTIMAFLRSIADRHGIRILDHSPALELLVSEGAAAGARGVNKQNGQTWDVRAGAVVIATGGTSFLSGVAGDKTHTGDGYLLAAEAGAVFSGMEFTGQYHAAPTDTYLTRGAFRSGVGTYYDNNGNKTLEGRQLVNAILETGGAWDQLDRTDDPVTQGLIRKTHAAAFQYFDRKGIDPFNERYPVSFVLEGSMRAGGGIAIDDDLATDVPGLFAAGDVTSREKITGGGPPGGGPASAWAFATGYFSGQSAARFATAVGPHAQKRPVVSVSQIGTQRRRQRDASPDEIIAAVREEMLPLEKNYWRTGAGMSASLTRLNSLWHNVIPFFGPVSQPDPKATARDRLRSREAASLLAAARWMYTPANERRESRGLHRRTDFPGPRPRAGRPAPDHGRARQGLGAARRSRQHTQRIAGTAGNRIVIEFIDADTCTGCGKCVEICPTDVFDQLPGAVPSIARQSDCSTCMNCELFCPADAVYVSPLKDPEVGLDKEAIISSGVMGSYRKLMNWADGEPPTGTGDNWMLQLRERQGERPPPESDKIRTRLYQVRDRDLIAE